MSKAIKIISGVWLTIFIVAAGESYDDSATAVLFLIGITPWIFIWIKGGLKSRSGNPYMDMKPYIDKTGFPRVKFSGLPMEKNEFAFYAIPAKRKVKGAKTTSQMYVNGTYIVTNKRVCFVAKSIGFGRRIKEIQSAEISGANTLSLKAFDGIYTVYIRGSHLGYAYSFTNGALNGLEEIDYSKAVLPPGYMNAIHKKV